MFQLNGLVTYRLMLSDGTVFYIKHTPHNDRIYLTQGGKSEEVTTDLIPGETIYSWLDRFIKQSIGWQGEKVVSLEIVIDEIEENERDYIDGQTTCLFCDSVNPPQVESIRTYPLVQSLAKYTHTGQMIEQDVSCEFCRRTWTEFYVLTAVYYNKE